MSFSENLQKLRKSNGLSQEQLAAQLGVSRQAISRWETGAIPDMENVIKISRFFGCTVEQLVDSQATATLPTTAPGVPHDHSPGQPTIRKTCLPETAFSAISILSLTILGILWFLSLVVDYEVVRQDTTTGYWYTGFSGFCEYYRLNGLVNTLLFLWPVCSLAEAYISIIIRERLSNRNYLVCRCTNQLLCIISAIFLSIKLAQPWRFPESASLNTLIALYISAMISTGIGMRYYKKEGESK